MLFYPGALLDSKSTSLLSPKEQIEGSLHHDTWPLELTLTSGSAIHLKPADAAELPFRHFVITFPLGKANENDLIEMSGLATFCARTLAKEILGDSECYSVTKNGSRTGSVPEIEHFHIYLFEDRQEKIATYAKNVGIVIQKEAFVTRPNEA